MKRILLILIFALPLLAVGQYGARPKATTIYEPGASTPLPSSVRLTGEMQPNDPGVEGQLSLGENYLYSYHNNLWKKTPRININ